MGFTLEPEAARNIYRLLLSSNVSVLFEIAPEIVFFTINYAWDLMMATAAVVIATVVFAFLGFS